MPWRDAEGTGREVAHFADRGGEADEVMSGKELGGNDAAHGISLIGSVGINLALQ